MKSAAILSIAIITVLGIPVPAGAHHAAAGIDQSATVSVTGTVREFRWANPHSWIEMDVVNDNGETQVWNLEMNPPSFLIRAGWTRTTITAGDEVTVVARPMLNGDPGGQFVSIMLPDGRELSQRAARGGAAGGN